MYLNLVFQLFVPVAEKTCVYLDQKNLAYQWFQIMILVCQRYMYKQM